MTKATAGWLTFLAALGMLLGLMAGEIAGLHAWSDAQQPAFVGKFLLHVGAVIAAFVGGKIIPSE